MKKAGLSAVSVDDTAETGGTYEVYTAPVSQVPCLWDVALECGDKERRECPGGDDAGDNPKPDSMALAGRQIVEKTGK